VARCNAKHHVVAGFSRTVSRRLPKLDVRSSILLARSNHPPGQPAIGFAPILLEIVG